MPGLLGRRIREMDTRSLCVTTVCSLASQPVASRTTNILFWSDGTVVSYPHFQVCRWASLSFWFWQLYGPSNAAARREEWMRSSAGSHRSVNRRRPYGKQVGVIRSGVVEPGDLSIIPFFKDLGNEGDLRGFPREYLPAFNLLVLCFPYRKPIVR
jgi:hypothetical protein